MSAFCYFTHDADFDKLAAWKRQATWFSSDDVKKVMTSVILDRKASWMARSAAIESMVGLGTSKADLEALGKRLDAKHPSDGRVLDKVASALAE